MRGRRKRDASVVVALCAICLMRAAADPTTAIPTRAETPNATAETPNATADGKHDDAELLRQVLTKKCLRRYTTTCLKLDAVRLIDRLATARAYQLMPGVSLVRTTAADGDNNGTAIGGGGLPDEVIRSLARGADESVADRLDGYLAEKVDAYLNSLSINVRLIDTAAVVETVRKLDGQMLADVPAAAFLETGRGKKNGMQMALWSAGTLAAIAIASLAAMSGKALMTAMLALALAAACALKGHQQQGGQYTGKTSHYEIITKPAVYEHDHLVHGAAAYSAAPYSYARHLNADEDDDDGGGTYHVDGGRHPQPPLLRVAADSSGRPDDDGNGEHETDVGQPPYPLSPVAYVPADPVV